MSEQHPHITVEGLEFRWDLEHGGITLSGVPCTLLFRDSSLAR